MLYLTLTHPSGDIAPVSIQAKTIAIAFPQWKQVLDTWNIRKSYNKEWVRHDLERPTMACAEEPSDRCSASPI